jgi:hypothetical protein
VAVWHDWHSHGMAASTRRLPDTCLPTWREEMQMLARRNAKHAWDLHLFQDFAHALHVEAHKCQQVLHVPGDELQWRIRLTELLEP